MNFPFKLVSMYRSHVSIHSVEKGGKSECAGPYHACAHDQRLLFLDRACLTLYFFHSTKNCENVETGTKCIGKSPRKVSRKSRNCWIHLIESFGNSGRNAKWNGNSIFPKIFGKPREVVLLFGNSRKCWSIRYWKFSEFKPEFSIKWKLSTRTNVRKTRNLFGPFFTTLVEFKIVYFSRFLIKWLLPRDCQVS